MDNFSNRRLPDLNENLEWNLVIRESKSVIWNDTTHYTPIPDRFVNISGSNVLAIGVSSDNIPKSWYTGGFVSQLQNVSPSSTSIFNSVMQSYNQKVRLNNLNLIAFPKLNSDWILRLSTPKWFKNVTWEVWRHDGRDIDLFTNPSHDWVDLEMINGATAIQGGWPNPGVCINERGLVEFRGAVFVSQLTNNTIAVLPEQFRPMFHKSLYFHSDEALCAAYVIYSGELQILGNHNYVILDDVTFSRFN